jgi:hypothetical protein
MTNTEKYKCPRCEAGEPVVDTGFFDWHGWTPQTEFDNAEQCLAGFDLEAVKKILATNGHRRTNGTTLAKRNSS